MPTIKNYNYEQSISNIGNFSFFVGEFTSNYEYLNKVSDLSKNTSNTFGYISFGIDFFQFIKSPNYTNSRDMFVSGISIADPYLGLFLQSYYSYQDFAQSITAPKKIKTFGNGFINLN